MNCISNNWHNITVSKNFLLGRLIIKKRILTILALIALVLIPFKNVYAEELNGGTTGENWRDSERVWKNMWTQSKDIYISIDTEVITAPEGYVFAGLEINGEVYPVGSQEFVTVRDDTTVKYLWNQLITEVEITLTQPFVGETNDMEQDEDGYWDWSYQTNPPVAEVAEDAPYTVEYTYWIMGWEGEEYDTPFVGTFERDTEYHAEIVLYSNLFEK